MKRRLVVAIVVGVLPFLAVFALLGFHAIMSNKKAEWQKMAIPLSKPEMLALDLSDLLGEYLWLVAIVMIAVGALAAGAIALFPDRDADSA